MGIEVVQEGEKRPLRLCPLRQPVKELAIDYRRRLAIDVKPAPDVLNGGPQPSELEPFFHEAAIDWIPNKDATDQDGSS